MAAVSLKPSSKGVTVLVVVAVMIFFGCVLAYLAAAGKLRGAASELEKKEKQVADSKEIAQKLEQSRLAYGDAQAQLRNLESSVSTQIYVPTLLRQIEYLGKSVNLKVVGVRPEAAPAGAQVRKLSSGAQAASGDLAGASEEKTRDGKPKVKEAPAPYDELKIDVEAEGRYQDALDFIYRLTSFPKIIAVEAVEMQPVARREEVIGSPRLAIKMKVTAFVFRDQPRAGTPGAPDTAATGRGAPGEGRSGNEAG